MAPDPQGQHRPSARRRVAGHRRCPGLSRHLAREATDGLPGLPAAVQRAVRLAAAGQHDAAAALLSCHLDPLDIDWLPADATLAAAYLLYATLITDGRQLPAAQYAAYASRHLYARDDARLRHALRILGLVLHQHALTDEAIAVRRELLAANQQAHDAAGTLHSQRDLAESLHTAGHCDDAVTCIDEAWQTWRQSPGTGGGLSTGTALLRTYLLLLRGCRRDIEVMALLHHGHNTGTLHALATTRTTESSSADGAYIIGHRSTVCARRPRARADLQQETPQPAQGDAAPQEQPADAGPAAAEACATTAPGDHANTSPHRDHPPGTLTALLKLIGAACTPRRWHRLYRAARTRLRPAYPEPVRPAAPQPPRTHTDHPQEKR